MKHYLIFTGCVVAVAGCVGYSIHTNHNFNAHQTVIKVTNVTRQVRQKLALQKQARSDSNKLKEVQLEVSNLQAQCEAGMKNYTLLTPYQKLQATDPVCSLQNTAPLSQ